MNGKMLNKLLVILSSVLSITVNAHSEVVSSKLTDAQIDAQCPAHQAQGISATNYREMLGHMTQLHCFSEGLAAAKVDSKFGYVNTNLEWVIPAKYEIANEFSNGRALVSHDLNEHGYTYISKKGVPINKNQYKNARNFSDGMAAVQIEKLWGYIDTSGTQAIPAKYQHADDFYNGFANVAFSRSEKLNYDGTNNGIIDKQGKWVAQPIYNLVFKFHSGVVKVAKGGSEGMLNTQGQFIIPLGKYTRISNQPHDNLISARNEKMKFGFFNTEGTLIIPFEYDSVLPFSQGKSFVKKAGTWLLIDKANKQHKELPYTNVARTIDSNRYYVSKNKHGKTYKGLIDIQGNIVIPVNFEELIYLGKENNIIAKQYNDEKPISLNQQGIEIAAEKK